MEFGIFEKFNNSIPTKLCANLLNNREFVLGVLSAR